MGGVVSNEGALPAAAGADQWNLGNAAGSPDASNGKAEQAMGASAAGAPQD
ncbi:MAG: hypothetical protein ACTHKB_00805 [Burkholderiaceae bacterium]